MYLVLEGYTGKPEKIKDKDLIYQFLDEYPTVLGMTKITAPVVCEYKVGNPRDWGISGFVLIAESHISIHTLIEQSYVCIDVYSFKKFDASRVSRDLCRIFALKDIKRRVLKRPFVEW